MPSAVLGTSVGKRLPCRQVQPASGHQKLSQKVQLSIGTFAKWRSQEQSRPPRGHRTEPRLRTVTLLAEVRQAHLLQQGGARAVPDFRTRPGQPLARKLPRPERDGRPYGDAFGRQTITSTSLPTLGSPPICCFILPRRMGWARRAG